MGLRVEEQCRVCGEPVWSGLERPDADRLAVHVRTLGAASLVMFFCCLGPVAGLIAIAAYRANVEFMEARDARTSATAYQRAHAGMMLARLTGLLSLFSLVVLVLLALAVPY